MPLGGYGYQSIARYFIRKEDERLGAMLERHRRRVARKARRQAGRLDGALDERLDEVEGDLGRMLLAAAAVHRLLIRKEIVESSDLVAVARELRHSHEDEMR